MIYIYIYIYIFIYVYNDITTYSGSSSGSSSGAGLASEAPGRPGQGAASQAGLDAPAANAAAAARYMLINSLVSFQNLSCSKKTNYLLRTYDFSFAKYERFQES